MSFGGFFKGLGHALTKVFSPNMVRAEAGIASIVLPGFAPLIVSGANAIISSEATAIAAGVQNGTGSQKFAFALAQFGPVYDNWAKQNNIPVLAENKNAFLQKTFELLQTLPAIAEEVTTGTTQTIEQQLSQPVNTSVPAPSATSTSAA